MANTTTEILSVNGVVLNTLAKNIESLTGRLRTPGKRTSNVPVPGRHGTLRVGTKLFDENLLALPMWVIGGDDDGKIPVGQTDRRLLFSNIDTLTRLFLGSQAALDIRHTLPDSSIRQCFGDVLDVIDFTTESADPMAKFGVSIVMADPFWYDLNQITQQVQANGATATFSSFAGATAPMDKLIFRLTGPWNSPIITFSDGSWFAVDVNIPAAATVTVNCETWTLSSTGVTTILANLRRSTSTARWATVPPTAGGLVITLAGASRTTATQLQVQGKRAYLVG
jgi:hypothetical protein